MKHFLVFLMSLTSLAAFAQPGAPTASYRTASSFGASCPGSVGYLEATGCSGTVTWSIQTGNGLLLDGPVGASVRVVHGSASSTYEAYGATCTDGSGTSDLSNVVGYTTGNVPPVPTLTANVTTQCQGSIVLLTASGCNTASGVDVIQWVMDGGTESNGQPNRCNYQSSCTRSLYLNQTYTFRASCSDGGANGCQSENAEVTITMTPTPPAPVLSASPASVCAGSPSILSASGCSGTVTWSTGETGASIMVNPVALGTNTYTATCTVNGCVGPPGSVGVTVNALPSAPSLSGPTSAICPGGTATLTASGCGGTVTWSTGQTGTSISVNPLVTTTYTATCNDNGCTSSAASVGVTVGSVPSAPSATVTQPTCSVAVGSISVSAPNAAEYSLNGGGYQASGTFANLAPGTYTITGRSSDGCLGSAGTFTVNPQPLTPGTAAGLVVQPTCAIGTGTINSSAANAAEYSLNGGTYQVSSSFANLAPGTYSITARSSGGCVGSGATFTINTQPVTPGTPSGSITQPTCSVGTGTITVSAANAVQYSLNGGGYVASGTFAGLAPGTYSITAQSADGCTGNAGTFTVNAQPATPGVPAGSVTPPTCNVATGTITVSAANGAEYSINGSAYGASGTFTSLAPGTYSITARSGAGCVGSAATFTVNPQPLTPATPSPIITQPTCSVGTGSVTVSALNAATYSLNGGTAQASGTFSNLAPGTYSITAQSADGCASGAASVVINAQPVTPGNPSGSVTQPTCAVGTGSITVSAANAAQYSINGGTYQGSGTFTGLAPGTYSIVAQSADGCVGSAATFTVNPQPVTPGAPTGSVTQPTCAVGTGTITVSASNGAEYSLNAGAYQTSGTFASLAPGTYSITARSSSGCVGSAATFTVNTQPVTPATPSPTVTQPTCSVATGSVTASALNAATYSLDGGTAQASGTFSGLAPGTYSITASSADGCVSGAASVVINAQPSTPGTPSGSVTQPTCTVGTGTITVSAANAAQYSINGGGYGASGTFTNLAPGTYSITAQSADGCVGSAATFTVSPQPITPGIPTGTVTQPTCAVGTGTITVSAPNAAQYSLNGGGYGASGTFANLTPGTYTITAQSSDGCVGSAATFTINAQPLTPGAPGGTVTQPTCSVNTGSISVSVPNAVSYSLDGGAYQASGTFAGLAPGTYSITAQSAGGCISAAATFVVITQPTTAGTPTGTVTDPTCSVAVGSISVSAANAVAYSVNGGAFGPSSTFTGLAPGTYSVTARSTDGCVGSATVFTVNAQPLTPPTPTATVTAPTCTIATGTINASATNGIEYSLNGGTYQPSGTFATLVPGTYSITARSAAGCVGSAGTFTVNPQPITPGVTTATVTQPTCLVSTGSVTFSAANATGYSINGGAFGPATVAGLSPGTYAVEARSADGCSTSPVSFVVNSQPLTPASPSLGAAPAAICVGSSTNLTATGCSGTITWSTGATGSTISVSPSANATYTATCSENGCTSTAGSVAVVVNAMPGAPTAGVVASPTCANPLGTIQVTAPLGAGIVYKANGTAQPGATFSLPVGSYAITVEVNGCASASTPVIVNAPAGGPASPISSRVQPTCTVPTGTITITAPTGADIEYSLDGTSYQTSTIFAGLAPGTSYNVTARFISTGCSSNASAATIDPIPANPATPVGTVTPPTCSLAVGSILITAPTGADLVYALNGGAATASTTFSNLAPGTYSVVATDGSTGCTSSTVSFTIPAQPVTPGAPTGSVTQPTCAVGTGTITVSASNGAEYSLNGGTYQASGSFANLAPGTFSITARSSSGCVGSAATFTVNAQPVTPATPAPTITQPTCSVGTGSVTASALNAATYSLNGGTAQASGTFSNLAPGTYSISAQSADGCVSGAASVVINAQPGPPGIPSGSVTQPTCSVATGIITVSAANATQYSLNGGTAQASGTFAGLAPGTYSITAQSADGCVGSAASFTVNAQPVTPGAPTGSVTQPTCAVATGSITVSAPNAAEYSLNGNTYGASGTFTSLAPGTYSITARSSSGCVGSADTFTVNTQPTTPSAPTVSVSNPTCLVATGSVTASSAGAADYSVDGGAYQASGTFSGLAAGVHMVVARSAAGCESAATSFTINAQPATPAAPTASVTTQPTCNVPVGGVTVSAPTGAGITYYADGTLQSGASFTLSIGVHTLTTRQNGCESVPTTLTVDPPAGGPATPTLTVSVQPTCSTPSGTVTVSAPTGVGIDYSLDGGAFATSATFAGLAPGSVHSVVARFVATGCVSNAASVTIGAIPANPSAAVVASTGATCDAPLGSLTVSSPTGSGLTYRIDGGTYQASPVFANLSAGTYLVQVQELATGCESVTVSASVAQTVAVATPTAVVSSQPNCTLATGTITVSAPTGANLRYSVDGSTYGVSPVFAGLSAGSYSVSVKDVTTGCVSAALTLTITAQPLTPAAPAVTVAAQPTCAVATGSITISGTDTYSYDGSTYQAAGTYTGLAPGTYAVTAKSGAGCVSTPTSITINAQPLTPLAPGLSASSATICAGATSTLTASGCAGVVTWSTAQTGALIIVSPSASQTFSAFCTENGCASTTTDIGITVNPIPAAPSVSVSSQPSCNTPSGTVVVSAPTGAGIGYAANGVAQTGSTFTLVAGTYTITASANGCVSPGTSVTVNPIAGGPATPTLTVSVQPTCSAPTGTIVVSIPTGANIDYSLDGGAYNSSATFAGLAPGSVHSVVARFSSTGCISTAASATIGTIPANPTAPTVSLLQPSCTLATGTITVSAPLGAGFEYSLGGAYTASNSFAGVLPGSYTITVREISTGCASNATSVTINGQPSTPAAPTASVTNPTCTVATGSVTASSAGAADYSVDGGAYQSSGTFSGLAAGVHMVVARSAAGCESAATSFTINAQPATPAAPTASVTTQPTCNVPVGGVTVSAPTGAGITYYADGTLQSGASFTLSIGVHTLTTRQNGCESAANSLTVNPPAGGPATPSLTVSVQPTCTNPTGTVVVSALTGAGIDYSLDGGAFATSASFTGLAPGSVHSVVARFVATGCVSNAASVTIGAIPANPSAAVVASTGATCDAPLGSLTVSSPTGSGLTYRIDGGTYQASPVFANLSAGTYLVQVQELATGCESVTVSASVAQTVAVATPTAVVSSQPNCTLATGTITVSAPTGANLRYSVDGSTYGVSPVFAGLSAGSYSVSVKDVTTGCVSAALTLTITAQPQTPAAPGLASSATGICVGSSATLTASGCSGLITWSTSDTGASLVVTPSASQTYTATCSFNGCVSSAGQVSVAVYAIPSPPSLSATSPVVNSGSATQLVASGCVGIVNWSTGQTGTPITVNPVISTTYTATCTQNGCVSGSATVSVTVDNCFGKPTSASLVDTGVTRCNGPAREKEQRDANPCSPTFNALSYVVVQPYGCASPTAVNDNTTTAFNTSVTIGVLSNDKGKDTTPAALTNVTVSTGTITGGTASVNPDGTVSFTPTAGFTGNATVAYTICDVVNTTACSSAVVTIAVRDACFGLSTAANFTDTGITRCSGPASEKEQRDNNACSSTYNTLRYVLIDPTGCASPTAVNDAAATPFNTSLTVTMLGNDLSRTGGPASLTNVVPTILATTGGTASLNPNGTVSFTPTAGFTGTATVNYQICDVGNSLCSTATISITVRDACFGLSTAATFTDTGFTRCNGPASEKEQRDLNACSATFNTVRFVVVDPYGCASPVAVNDVTTTAYNTPLTVSVLGNDRSHTNTPASLTNVTIRVVTTTGGTATITPAGEVRFLPTSNFTGTATVIYQICRIDNATKCSSATTTITVQDACFGQSTAATFTPTGATRCNGVVLEREERDGNSCSSTFGTIRYVPIDLTGCASPTAVTDAVATPFNTPVTVSLLTNDKDRTSSPANLTNVTAPVLVSAPANGSATITNGVLTYTPTPGFVGTDVVTYQICDPQNSRCSSASVLVTVRDACFGKPTSVSLVVTGLTRCNGPALERELRDGNTCSPTFGNLSYEVVQPNGCASPTAVADVTSTSFNTPVTVSVLSNDKGKDTTPASLSNVTVSVGNTTGGTAWVNPNGTVEFKPTVGFSGTATITYTICDVVNTSACSTATITVVVRDACYGKPTSASYTETATTRCNGPALEVLLRDQNPCSASYLDTKWQVVQPYGCASPTAVLDNTVTAFNTPLTVSILTNDKAKDGTPASVTNVTVSLGSTVGGTSTINPDGTVSFTPTSGFTGTATIVYTICDKIDVSKCSSTSVLVTVRDACFGKPTSASFVDTGATRCNGIALEKEQRDVNTCSSTYGSLTYVVVNPTGCASPSATVDATTTPYGNPVRLSILPNDRCSDGSPASLTTVYPPEILSVSTGTAAINPDGSLSFTPTVGFIGVATVIYKFCEKTVPAPLALLGNCASTTVTITVLDPCFGLPTSASYVSTNETRCNGPARERAEKDVNTCSPTVGTIRWVVVDPYGCASVSALSDFASTSFNTPVSITVLGNDRSRMNTPASLTNVTMPVVTASTHGTATMGANGVMRFTPEVGFSGVATVVYRICDAVSSSVVSSSLAKTSAGDSSTLSTNCASATVTIYIGESPCAPGQGRPLQVTRINLDCYKSSVCIETCGGDGTPIQYFGIGATSWSNESCEMIGDDLVHYDPKVLMFRLVQGGQQLTVPYDLVTAAQGCPVDSRPWNRVVPGSPAPPGVIVTVPGNPTAATGQAFTLLAPIYNCQTGAMSFRFSGGDGTPVEFMGVGITGWTGEPIVFVEAGIRIDRPTVTINARQSGVVRSVTVDLTAYCNGQTAPISSTAPSATVVTPVSVDPSAPGSPTVTVSTPVTTIAGGVFRIIEPYYNCQTGAFTFRSGGADGGSVEYMAVGITGWTTSVNHVLDAGLRNNADLTAFTLKARVNGVEVSYNWDLRYFCTQALAQPAPVTITAPASPTSATATVPVTATTVSSTGIGSTTVISGVSTSGVATTAPVASVTVGQVITTPVASTTTAPVVTTSVANAALRMVAPLYNCQTGALTFRTEGGNGTRIEYMGIGVTGWTTNALAQVDAALRTSTDVQPLTLKARQSGVEVQYSFDLRGFCNEKTAPAGSGIVNAPVSVTPIIVVPDEPLPLPVTIDPIRVVCVFPVDSVGSPVVKPTPIVPAPFSVLEPVYNCQTGSFRFRSTAVENTVEYMAVGITGWTTGAGEYRVQPFADAKPYTLLARLVANPSVVVSLDWDYRSVCGGSARLASEEIPLEVTVLGNPVTERTVRFVVKGRAGASMRLDMLNVSGALVDELSVENAPVEGHFQMQVGESAGVYLLRVRRGNEVQTVKIVKQ